MAKGIRLTSDRRIRSGKFRLYLKDRLPRNLNEGDYQAILRESLVALAWAIAEGRGLQAPAPDLAARELASVVAPEQLGELYEEALGVWPCLDSGSFEWISQKAGRRGNGIYYTPAELVEPLVRFALPKRRQCLICDPACGSGAFLLAALQRLSGAGSTEEVVSACLFGSDTDPTAVELCRWTLYLTAGHFPPEDHIRCANSLLLDWSDLFPGPMSAGGFDAVIGNPPFGGVVDGRVPVEVRAVRESMFSELGGTSDLSYYFLARALKSVNRHGRVAMVLPRTFLSAPSAEAVRNAPGFRLSMVTPLARHDSFQGASVHVCLVGYSHTSRGGRGRSRGSQSLPPNENA
ncbi:MAG: hypothetical protein QOJ65_744, partial [Fimbriimonadaceae bacterium]|nr:hypothetical protein [Fimbriimonadaceae bacterium]